MARRKERREEEEEEEEEMPVERRREEGMTAAAAVRNRPRARMKRVLLGFSLLRGRRLEDKEGEGGREEGLSVSFPPLESLVREEEKEEER